MLRDQDFTKPMLGLPEGTEAEGSTLRRVQLGRCTPSRRVHVGGEAGLQGEHPVGGQMSEGRTPQRTDLRGPRKPCPGPGHGPHQWHSSHTHMHTCKTWSHTHVPHVHLTTWHPDLSVCRPELPLRRHTDRLQGQSWGGKVSMPALTAESANPKGGSQRRLLRASWKSAAEALEAVPGELCLGGKDTVWDPRDSA